MNRLIFDYLYTKGINKKEDTEAYFNQISKKKIEKFILDINSNISETQFSKHNIDNTFHFFANQGFSGSIGCPSISCGLERVQKLNRITALYSDLVYIFNPFEKYERILKSQHISIDFIRARLAKDIYNIFILKEVILAGRIQFVNKEKFRYCIECYPDFEEYAELFFDKFTKTISPELKVIYSNQCDFYVENIEQNSYEILVQPKNTDLLEHSSMGMIINEKPSNLIKKIHNRKSKKIWKNELSSELLSMTYNSYLIEIIEHSYFSNLTSSNFLSDRTTDINLLKTLSTTPLQQHEKSISPDKFINGLSHSLPLANELNISDIIELRNKEGEAFENYRIAFQKFIIKSHELSPKEIKEAFKDEISKELNKIDLTVKSFREAKKKSIISNVISLSAFVYIGLFSGILPPAMGNAVAALSSFNNISCLLQNSLNNADSKIRDNKYFFIWKTINN